MQRWGLWNAVEHGGACAMGETGALTTAGLDPMAEAELRQALARIERGRGLIVRLADIAGGVFSRASSFGLRQIGFGPGLPARFAGIAEAALARAYDVAILGLAGSPASRSALSQAAVIGSGALSGFAGLAGFVPDAAFTTLTIMREIARIAAQQGEDLSLDDARRACLEVFAFQGSDTERGEADYFTARMLLGNGTFSRLLSDVAARYGSVLGEKLGLQAVPLAGAIAGASLNAAFLAHYRNLAEAHFTIRRLEREHGREAVRAAADAANQGRHAPFNAA